MRGVSPFSFAALTSAPAAIRALTTIGRPFCDARIRAVFDSSELSCAFTSTSPSAIRRCTSTMCPRPAASMNASPRSSRVRNAFDIEAPEAFAAIRRPEGGQRGGGMR
jgi:hypothetical protein